MVGCRSEMFAGMPKSMTSVSGDRVSRKVQLSAAASAIATILTSGRSCLICATSLASCAFM